MFHIIFIWINNIMIIYKLLRIIKNKIYFIGVPRNIDFTKIKIIHIDKFYSHKFI